MSEERPGQEERLEEKKADEKKITRRAYLKYAGGIVAAGAIAAAGYGAYQFYGRPITPITTAPTSTMTTLSEALRHRKSINGFQQRPLSSERLLDLLWAAWGINRPDSGKRTAPTAMNSQAIDVYVLLPEGAYLYDARGNQLTPVLAEDLRAEAATQEFIKEAPILLVFVADYAKFRNIPQPQMELYSAAHTGFIGQNVYLYCASEGLGAHFYASIDRASLTDSLKLRSDQAIVFAQAVGYPKE